MTGKAEYRGIQYLVESLGARRWRWLVTPPTCVLGLSVQEGEVEGERGDAVDAARAAIQSQSLFADARQAD